MKLIWWCNVALPLIGALWLFGSAQANAPSATSACALEGPVLMDKQGRPIWLSSDALVKRATRCVAPQLPALGHGLRIHGYVFVDIVIDEKGQVRCIQLVSGHPLLSDAAMQAAKDWTFRPEQQRGKPISFSGHLRFHFSTATPAKKRCPCTEAHW
jgi:TonB family protein